MRKLFSLLNDYLNKGTDAVLVTIVASSGSTPRGTGARMLVTQEGRIWGTVGGGAVEHHSEIVAGEVLNSKNSHAEHFRLKKNQIQDLGMVCGGDVNVYFQYICAQDKQNRVLIEKIEALFEAKEEFWLVNEITENEKGGMAVCGKNTAFAGIALPPAVFAVLGNKPAQAEAQGRKYYCEKILQTGRVCIFGGGHVSQALVPALAAIDFRCVVLEDREEFCKIELFPGAEEVLLIENNHLSEYLRLGQEDYVCIMTRGHKDDLIIQAQVLKTPAHYIGVIGSRHKRETVFKKLREQGFTDQDLERITTPIGLDIGAETPREIAVSIAAQLIQIRANKS